MSETLDTGMKVTEALHRAEQWWQAKGRFLIKKHDSETASLDPENANFIPSGIVNGLPWDELTKREKLHITKAYHHEFIRKPQTLGE
ncbi:MAG TPA: hypothetical protein VJM50_21195 [Pyrinomonadaceae bacterium]|nr:hypothetical protein [Pyrinomonadaceae bacterium]